MKLTANAGASARFKLLASSGMAAIALAASPALAQDAATAEDTDTESAVEGPVITVTGSRILRPEVEGAAPLIASIDAATIEQRQFNNVSEVLNEIPGFGLSVSSNGGQAGFSVGQNFANLFGLGSQRTLTLVNGRRFVSSNTASNFGGAASGLQVDLNVIPVSLIEGVDVLTARGATIYGSDAVAGTVNLRLRDDFEGVETSARYGIFEEGDGETLNASVTVGGNFAEDRGNIAVNFEYTDSQGILSTARDRTAAQLFRSGDNLLVGRRISALTRGGIPTQGFTFGSALPAFGAGFTGPGGGIVQFASNGDLVPFDLGATSGAVNSEGGDGLNLAETAQIASELERLTLFATAHYDITDNVRFFMEANYADTNAAELANQPVFQSQLFGGDSGSLGILLSNPFLNDQARGVLLSPGNLADAAGVQVLNFDTDGDGVDDDTQFSLQRASLDLLGGRNPNFGQLDLFRSVFGLEGDLELGGRDYQWQVSYNYGRSQAVSTSTSLVQENFINAVDAVTDADGNIVCRVTRDGAAAASTSANVANTPEAVNAVSGCVPLNLFGDGAPSAEAIDFVTTGVTSESQNTQRIFNANVGGSPFDIFSNPVSFNIGYENRRERARFTPDGFLQEGLGRSVAIAEVVGAFETNEFFGELFVPVIQPENDSFFYRLEFDGSIRFIDNSLAGSGTAWTVGGVFAPIEDVSFRGSYTESVRAPAITELFLPAVSVFSFADDPCDADTVNDGPDPATRAANCASIGIDTSTFQSTIEDASQEITSAGNPNLVNETSQAWTAGVIIQPRFIPNFSLAVDWIDVELTNAIETLDLTDILASCFDSPNFPNAPTCNQFTRDGTGQITGALTGDLNVGAVNFAGLQTTLRYNFDVSDLFGGESDLGNLGLVARYFYQDESNETVVDSFTDFNGEVADFRHEANATLTYRIDGSTFSVNGVYFSSSVFDNDEAQVDPFDVLSDYLLINTTFSQEINDNFTFRLTVDNLFNEEAPFPSAATNTFNSGILGRRYTAGISARF
ncbi:TonB-dependent receptor domain-containing protein [Erythrobacter sp. W53]|uniref:TonB-dependent receptor domain-containing protein n=1 Tax=Erythrobacter sp. W53 TaxID=3425947 RepID=UPI003D768E7A